MINRAELGEFDLIHFRVVALAAFTFAFARCCHVADQISKLCVSEHSERLLSTGTGLLNLNNSSALVYSAILDLRRLLLSLPGLSSTSSSALVSSAILDLSRLLLLDLATVRIGTVSVGSCSFIQHSLPGSFDCCLRGGLGDLERLLFIDPGNSRCVRTSYVLNLSKFRDPLRDGSVSSHPREVLSHQAGCGRVGYYSFDIVDVLLLFIFVNESIAVLFLLFPFHADCVRIILNFALFVIHISCGDYKQVKIVVR